MGSHLVGPFFQHHLYADYQGWHHGTAVVAGEAALAEMVLMLVEMIVFSEHPLDE